MSGFPDRFRIEAEQKLPALYLIPFFALQVKAFTMFGDTFSANRST